MSEVARLRRQIEEEYKAAQFAMTGYAITARHDFITRRMENVEGHRKDLVKLVGDEEAMKIIIEVNDRLAPPQSRSESRYCVLVNGEVVYFGLVQGLAEDAWRKAIIDPRNRIEVTVNDVSQAVREPQVDGKEKS